MTPAAEAAVRAALLERMRGRDLGEVANLAGVHRKTLRRLLEGSAFGVPTVQAVARVLRVDLDAAIADSARAPAPPGNAGGRNLAQDTAGSSPVAGWKAAAALLQVSEDTLLRARQATGDPRKPWWPSAQALREWFDRLAVTGW